MPYLRSYQGDPGFGSFLKKALRIGVGFATGGPVGAALATASVLAGGAKSPARSMATLPMRPAAATPIMAMPAVPVMQTATQMRSLVEPVPGIPGAVQRFLPGGRTGFRVGPDGRPVRRRRMNVANAKALRRAIRRQSGFVKLARKALKGTGYTIVSRGSRSRRPVSIKESGPGSVIVR